MVIKTGAINLLRSDLRAMLNDGINGPDLVLERISSPGARTRISLKADEWQELLDWVRAISLLG